ncbi:MAG: SOS response-associated peptidase family protein [Pseudomonadota bacterium]
MCNLYSMTKAQTAIRELFDGIKDETGNLPALPEIYPDKQAAVIANMPEGLKLTMMRWGMPSPAFALKNRNYDRGVTNVRNTKSPHWRRWLGPQNRCLVPFTAFSEPGKDKKPVWFDLGEDQPLAFFAGIWTSWTSVRKVKDGETTDNLFGFLTCDPNEVVAAVHSKAMPVVLTQRDEVETWLNAPVNEALTMQRALPDGALRASVAGAEKDKC